ncbi:pirin family protein [Algiphilus sp. NNCM1]|uniref:pirin family protein n=1 Tax=Algiphilus sp. TaxID=1872431 RepID=UPI001CA6DEBB|nr:pirin family protein [Algiphilus sp.]MBY8964639.1 pirin family protein [Algiphilus acroporae]MCI5063939.1 pirin family protein [Algiphilus sp.]MCI5102973.1 pirin family protein [Algiphilus sp.]
MAIPQHRPLLRRIPGQDASDGAGVRLKRSIGSMPALRLDPFLMLDAFSSDRPDDYIAGFPDHPHRGFETVTYMLDGHMQHRDHMGNTGDLGPGSVQWMTAGRGIIHSEMPMQRDGRMRGFQLWINLPAALKMQPPAYRDIPADAIPSAEPAEGVHLRCIAGHLEGDTWRLAGAVNANGEAATDPILCDLWLAPHAGITLPVPDTHAAFVYLYEGAAQVDDAALSLDSAHVLGDGSAVSLRGGDQGGRCLLVAGKPLGEPIVQYGPFVMNTREEIEQALDDYRRGVLAA